MTKTAASPSVPSSPTRPATAATSPTSAYDLERWQKAQQDLLRGRPDRAIATYRDLLKRFPQSEKLWFELGLAAARELDFDQADTAFQRAAEAAPRDINLLILLGQQYHLLRRFDRARAAFQQAVAADPQSLHARLSLADWYEREHRLDDTRATLADAPPAAPIRCFQALLLQRQDQTAEAETILRELIATPNLDLNTRYTSRHQLAVLLDQTGRYDEALRWLGEAKQILRQTANVAKLEQTYDQADRRRRQLLADLTSGHIRRWQSAPAGEFPARPAFLGGHPRSGTTLLEQILGAHPAVAAFDEPMAFTQEILEPLAPLENAPTLTITALDQITEARRAQFQQRYLKNLGRDPRPFQSDGVLLEKNPSHTASLHLWLRLFPQIKTLIALRDPRDVIISCAFQNLALNATNANFLSLDRTVKHYCDLMDVWLRLRELGEFQWLETRYEDLVTNLETEGRRVTEFLGLDWQPQQADFPAAARAQTIVAPNYREVIRPVYQRAVGRWQNYTAALAPFQTRLAPYCQALGYS